MSCPFTVLISVIVLTGSAAPDAKNEDLSESTKNTAEPELVDPHSEEFQREWQQMVDATCPEIATQRELAYVITLRIETLKASYEMLSSVTLTLIDIYDQSAELLKLTSMPEERIIIEEFRGKFMEAMLDRFGAELNRTASWIESSSYEQQVFYEERHGTDIEPEQLRVRCFTEFNASLRECVRMNDFVLKELAKLEAQTTYFRTRNNIMVRSGRLKQNESSK